LQTASPPISTPSAPLCRRTSSSASIAIQAVGVIPIDVKRSKITSSPRTGTSGCVAPRGGDFLRRSGASGKLEVLEVRLDEHREEGKFIDCPIDLMPDARRFEQDR